jgi:hypothetical protein
MYAATRCAAVSRQTALSTRPDFSAMISASTKQRSSRLKTAGLSKCDHVAGHFKKAYLAIRVEGRENSAT